MPLKKYSDILCLISDFFEMDFHPQAINNRQQGKKSEDFDFSSCEQDRASGQKL